MRPLLEAHDLTVGYDHRIAVANVSLTLNAAYTVSFAGSLLDVEAHNSRCGLTPLDASACQRGLLVHCL